MTKPHKYDILLRLMELKRLPPEQHEAYMIKVLGPPRLKYRYEFRNSKVLEVPIKPSKKHPESMIAQLPSELPEFPLSLTVPKNVLGMKMEWFEIRKGVERLVPVNMLWFKPDWSRKRDK